ncbi:MAG: toxic anion resistance protein [Eubacterium sp.]|nr:toxic anion resistance protein [Eubacterium sp.]
MSEFKLSLPTDEEIKKEVQEKTRVDEKKTEELAKTSDDQVAAILAVDIDNPEERSKIVKTIEGFGDDAVIASRRKNEFLAKRIATFKNNSDETSVVATSLTELSVQMKSLDPSGINFSSGIKSHFLNPIRRYFAKYEKADTVIEGILTVITNGEKQLKNDNQTLLIEQQAIEQETARLNEYIALGQQFDAALSEAVEKAKLEGVDDRKIEFFETEVLFPLRQKVMDMGTLSVVNYQGIGAIDVIRKNNNELIRGVERAKQVSVAALRIGVMCAQALYNQKLVLNAVKTLNDSTSQIIEANANMLGKQSGEIQEMSANPMIAVETLQESFRTVFDVMDACEDYKRSALPQMAETVRVFSELGAEGEERVRRMQAARDYNDSEEKK